MSGWKQSTGNGQKPVLGTRRLPTRARGPGLGLSVRADNGAFSIYFVLPWCFITKRWCAILPHPRFLGAVPRE